MALITITLGHRVTLPIPQFKKSLLKLEWLNYLLRSFSSFMSLLKKSKGTVNLLKTEQSEIKSLKFSSALTNCWKKLLLVIKTIGFISQDGSTFSSNILTKSTDLTSNNVWSASCKTTHFPSKLQSTRIKSISLSTPSLRKLKDKPSLPSNT